MFTDARSTFEEGLRVFNDQWLKELNPRFAGKAPEKTKRLLEHHTRAFVLDKLLFALGWRQEANAGGQQNLLTEAFYKTANADETTVFLDYLGFDAVKDLPLLIFEAKRFGSVLPSQLIKLGLSKKPRELFKSSADALSAAFKNPSWLKGHWKEHHEQLTKYYNSVVNEHKQAPGVMGLGNGEWLVIIRNPERAFTGKCTADDFLVIEPEEHEPIGQAYLRQLKDIYDLIAFERLCRTARGVPPELIPTQIRSAKHVELMRGVRVGYRSMPKLKADIHPYLDIEPVAFVRIPTSPWILVELPVAGHELPHIADQLPGHLARVEAHSNDLVTRISQQLAVHPTVVGLAQHYGDGNSFSTRAGFSSEDSVKAGIQTYVLATGTEAHFIRAVPRVLNCPRHVWTNCHPVIDGRHPSDRALANPSVLNTKAFFPDGWAHHCAAGVTYNSKSAPHDKNLLRDFGRRSSEDGSPFCEIFDFEQMLCCQTCVFIEVCEKSKLFRLPCMVVAAPAIAPVGGSVAAAAAPL